MPFKPSLTGLITSLDNSGKLYAAEILEKMNVIEFTSKSEEAGKESDECKVRSYPLAVVSPSRIRKKFHSTNDPGVVQVNSN